MALQGKFIADFASFYDAVQQAEVSLRGFETGAGKVEKSLNRMVDSFSGRKIIQDATMMVEAVERVGGASKLTESEMRRVNATVGEAVAKYAALGQSAPANLVALADATKGVEAPTAALNTKMVALGAAIGTMAAHAIEALGRLVVNGIQAVGTAITNLVMEGSKISGIDDSFQSLTRGIGESADVMLGKMHEGTRGLVSDFDLMTAANKAVLLGLPATAKDMGALASTATILGRAMGMTATQAFGALIVALGRTSPLILDNLGLSVKVGAANETYAAALNKTVGELTDAEKKTAFYNAAMEAARQKVADLGEAQLTLGEHIQTAGIQWTNFKNDLAIAIARSPVLSAGLVSIGHSMMEAFGGERASAIEAINAGINKIGLFLVDVGMVLIEWGHTAVTVFGLVLAPIHAISAALSTLAAGINTSVAALADVASYLPGVGKSLEGVADKAHLLAAKWSEQAVASWDAAKQDVETIKGHGALNASLDTMTRGLVNAKAAMVAAMLITAQATPTQAALTRAVTDHASAVNVTVASLDTLQATLGEGVMPAMREFGSILETVVAPPLKEVTAQVQGLAGSMGAMSAGPVSFAGVTVDAAYTAAHQFDPGYRAMIQEARMRNFSPTTGGTNIYVSGTFGTVQQVTDAVSAALVAKSGRKF
ncbi:MAG: hypothetical protein ABIH03_12760 [Pseudomonadota bacterium]